MNNIIDDIIKNIEDKCDVLVYRKVTTNTGHKLMCKKQGMSDGYAVDIVENQNGVSMNLWQTTPMIRLGTICGTVHTNIIASCRNACYEYIEKVIEDTINSTCYIK